MFINPPPLSQNMQLILNRLRAHDSYTEEHCRRVWFYLETFSQTQYGIQLSQHYNISFDNLSLTGLLHDTGKIKVDRSILLNPLRIQNMSPSQYDNHIAQIRLHPKWGANIVSQLGLSHLAPGIRSHHERWDGTGYPDNLKGNDIPIEGRIVAIFDSFSAMTEPRPYRVPRLRQYAIEQLKGGSGTQFDPALIDLILPAFMFLPYFQRSFGLATVAQ